MLRVVAIVSGLLFLLLSVGLATRANSAEPIVPPSEAPAANLLPFVLERPLRQPGEYDLDPGDLRRLADWLSRQFELAPAPSVPAVRYLSSEGMLQLLRQDLTSGIAQDADPAGSAAQSSIGSDVVAIYDTREMVIYLPERWTGQTPGEQSVLVHEMVHHLQNAAAEIHACPQAREKAAYQAQQNWLALSGRDLESEFGIDALTLLVRTQCGL